MAYTVTYTHSRPNLVSEFFATAQAQLTHRVAQRARHADGFVSQASTVSADKLVNTVVVTWRDQAAATAFNLSRLAVAYRKKREAYDAAHGTSTTIKDA
jgi:hypothetical protein